MSGGSKVLLLEADMRRPVLADWHSLENSPGLAEAITHDIALDEVIQRVSIGRQTNGPGTGAELDVIVAGAIPPNPSEMIESRKMGEILKQLTEHYDVVIVDTPPTSLVADSIPLMNQVEGVIVVGRIGRITRDSAAELREQLNAMGAPALGLVANMLPERSDVYNYGYR
jgi:capsular exopolysaccharide synthesis family protein